MDPRHQFSDADRARILESIKVAESKTSGEIRLFVEDHCKADVLDRAAFVFRQLKMDRTKERNGVLFYLAMVSRKFAIIGDAGINAKVEKDFWNSIKEEMAGHFAKGEFSEGLEKGIRRSGEALSRHFPHQADDKNELPDDIVYGND